ncbi:MAG: GntR family transcriptional regulator [Gammaproteobacteria bacterium]|nr:GntR family transcriptional regulator [Gammaproteobacteria bacterium]
MTQPKSVGESTYSAIRQDIFMGTWPPGSRLKLEQLRKQYDTSVTTLREILNRLSAEGFVLAEGNKGFEVSPISATELREVGELRVLLENHAIALSFAQGDVEWESRVVATHHRLKHSEARVIAGDDSARPQWKQDDIDFHHALISACGSKTLMEMHDMVFSRYLRYQMLTLTCRGEVTAEDHQNFLDYALARDTAKAQALLLSHVTKGIEHAIAHNQQLI